MTTVITVSDANTRADLEQRFPGWRFLHSDQDRWWALRAPLPPDRMDEIDVVEANIAGDRRAKLKRLTAVAR